MEPEPPTGGAGSNDPAPNSAERKRGPLAGIPSPRSGDDRAPVAAVAAPAPVAPAAPPVRTGPRASALNPGMVLVTAFGAYFLMVAFLAGVLFAPHPPDLSKLGISALVTTTLGVVVTPQNSTHDIWWWGLVALTVAGIAGSGVMALFYSGGHPSAAAVTAAFIGALSGLLTDGGKLRLPSASTAPGS